MKPSYFYNGNSYTVNLSSLYWGGPQVVPGVSDKFQSDWKILNSELVSMKLWYPWEYIKDCHYMTNVFSA